MRKLNLTLSSIFFCGLSFSLSWNIDDKLPPWTYSPPSSSEECVDGNIIAHLLYESLRIHAAECINECETVDNKIKDILSKLEKFITDCESGSGECNLNNLNQIVGITNCFLSDLRNNRQNLIVNDADNEFTRRFQNFLVFYSNLSAYLDNNFLNDLENNLRNHIRGHFQQIWNFIFDENIGLYPDDITNGNEFCQKLQNIYNNSNYDVLTKAQYIYNLLQDLNDIFLPRCEKIVCGLALKRLLFVDLLCHNYFVDTYNYFINKGKKNIVKSFADGNVFADKFCGASGLGKLEGEFGNKDLYNLFIDIGKTLANITGDTFCADKKGKVLLWLEY